MSKIRYGAQLYGNVRLKDEDVEQKLIGGIQVAQNKLARFLNGNKLQDHIPTKDIYKELKIPTVNQINAQIKLLEVWKSQHIENYPMKWTNRNDVNQDRRTRASSDNVLCERQGCKTLNSTFATDAARIWNQAPQSIKSSLSLYSAKKNIKAYALSLPI